MAEDAALECDLLVRNAYVITLDERRQVYPAGASSPSARMRTWAPTPARGPSMRVAEPFIQGWSTRMRT
jgi:hypothetical protein